MASFLGHRPFTAVTQVLVSAPPCHGGGRGFKSRPGRKGFGVVFKRCDIRTLFGLVAQLVRAND